MRSFKDPGSLYILALWYLEGQAFVLHIISYGCSISKHLILTHHCSKARRENTPSLCSFNEESFPEGFPLDILSCLLGQIHITGLFPNHYLARENHHDGFKLNKISLVSS